MSLKNDELNRSSFALAQNKRKRDIPTYLMAEIFVEVRCLAFVKALLFMGCDVTSKLRTKAASPKANMVLYLKHFGEEPLSKQVLHQAQKYLVMVVGLKSTCHTFDEPRYKVYTIKENSL